VRACPAGATVISDFEEDALVVEPAFGPIGAWYTNNDATAGGTQTLVVESKNPSTMCDKYDAHAQASGYPQYSGFGVTLMPDPANKTDPSKKHPESFAAYTGFQYDIKQDATSAPVFFEVLTVQNQPASGGGTAMNSSVDAYNTRGILMTSIPTSWTTVYVPFGIMGPRYLPTGCAANVFCEAPALDPTSVLGFQYSVVSQFGATGDYNVSVDNVDVMTSTTNGLAAPPSTAGATFPFPQDSGMVGSCAKPSGTAGRFLVDAYDKWKKTFVVSAGSGMRVQRPQNNNDTVSEGIAYGMLIAVYMDDKALFDGLWTYWQTSPNPAPLMNWNLSSGGGVIGSGSATDADEDAAYALYLAGKQWGGTYGTSAKSMITAIWNSDIEASTLAVKGGSTFSGSGSALTNPSYFAPAYYRVFAQVDTAHNWMGVVNTAYTYLANIVAHGSANGLVPAWCSNTCDNAGGGSYPQNNEYQYDAHRVPWRIGLDACWNNESRAKTYVNLVAGTSGFFGTAAASGLGSLADIYQTSGTKDSAAKSNSMSLIGAMGVGAMAAGNSALAARAYRFLLDATYSPDPVGAVAAYTYYNATVGLLAALTMSGNFTPH
jgi:endo-1,4-beta-D-glucanase Y